MNPYQALNVEREPFSNTPDPSFLARTRQHATCLQELEIAIRLRRGLNIVTGEIGTGKTTLCRSLVRAFAGEADTDLHLMLDPRFDSSEEFLRVLLLSLARCEADPGLGLWQLKEALKQELFRQGMLERKLVVLVIDEGQKMAPEHLELLRELLNYETNSVKLLQIVIFAQRELEPVLDAMPNLKDRVNVLRRLSPLSLAETRAMIRHRLAVASGGSGGEGAGPDLFRPLAVLAVHRLSGGSPRRIVRLCHKAMLEMLVRGKSRVGLVEVLSARQEGDRLLPGALSGRMARPIRAALAVSCIGAVTLALLLSLGGGGPVLSGGISDGAGAAPLPGPAQPLAGAGVLPAALELDERPVPQGLTLRALPDGVEGSAGQADPASRVSLLPVSDAGPAMRGEVTAAKPVGEEGSREAAPAPGVSAPREPAPPAVKARLLDANAAKPLVRGVDLSLARP